MEFTAFTKDAFYHAAWSNLNSITMHGIHCIQSGCFGPRCIDSTAYNQDPLRHNAWNPLHSITLHGIHCIQSGCFGPCCIKSTAFKHIRDYFTQQGSHSDLKEKSKALQISKS